MSPEWPDVLATMVADLRSHAMHLRGQGYQAEAAGAMDMADYYYRRASAWERRAFEIASQMRRLRAEEDDADGLEVDD